MFAWVEMLSWPVAAVLIAGSLRRAVVALVDARTAETDDPPPKTSGFQGPS